MSGQRINYGLRGLIAFASGEEIPKSVVSPSYIKQSLINTKRAWRRLGIKGSKTVKEILHQEKKIRCVKTILIFI